MLQLFVYRVYSNYETGLCHFKESTGRKIGLGLSPQELQDIQRWGISGGGNDQRDWEKLAGQVAGEDKFVSGKSHFREA